MDGGCLSAAIKKAGLNLIYLLEELMSDLAFAPRLCSQNISRREAGEKGTTTMNPFSQGRFQIDIFLNSPQAGERVLKW